MRTPCVLMLAALAVFAQEGPEKTIDAPPPAAADAHDELGFPITFNEEIITLSDLERELGGKLRDVMQIKNARDGILMRLLGEQVAVRLGIEVEHQELERWMQMRIDERGGDAKFYEFLAQRGDTLERFKEQQRQVLLQRKLLHMFKTGISPGGRKLLPWRVRPTPRDMERAYRNDRARWTGNVRIRRLEMVINLDKKARDKLAAKQLLEGLTPEEVKQLADEQLQGRVDDVLAQLQGGRSFASVAQGLGVDTAAQEKEWITLPPQASENPSLQFVATAEPGTVSGPLPLPGGGYRILKLLERERPKPPDLKDPEVAQEYEMRIRELRGRKWEAYLKLKAIDASTIRPRRVADEIRKLVVAELRDAEGGLKELGLH